MARLEDRLAALATMSSAQLRAEWTRVTKQPAPALSPDLLLREIAYRLQEQLHGRLAGSIRRQLDRHIAQLDRSGEAAPVREIVLKTGTRLVRDWHGRSHHVLVLDQGYMFEDRQYSSLTRIAAEITGAKWSGPRFFGLARRPKPFAEGRAHG